MTFQGKHDFGELEGKRVTFVEKNISEERMKFLKALLEYNGFSVIVAKDESETEELSSPTYTVGVEDLLFNPTVWVYERRLRTPDGRIVSPAFWEQKTKETRPQYWEEMFKNDN